MNGALVWKKLSTIRLFTFFYSISYVITYMSYGWMVVLKFGHLNQEIYHYHIHPYNSIFSISVLLLQF